MRVTKLEMFGLATSEDNLLYYLTIVINNVSYIRKKKKRTL